VEVSICAGAALQNHIDDEATPLEVLDPLETLRYGIATFYLASALKFLDSTCSQLRTEARICSGTQLAGSERLLLLLVVAQAPDSYGMPSGDLPTNIVLVKKLGYLLLKSWQWIVALMEKVFLGLPVRLPENPCLQEVPINVVCKKVKQIGLYQGPVVVAPYFSLFLCLFLAGAYCHSATHMVVTWMPC
jgi:hypothetical protein